MTLDEFLSTIEIKGSDGLDFFTQYDPRYVTAGVHLSYDQLIKKAKNHVKVRVEITGMGVEMISEMLTEMGYSVVDDQSVDHVLTSFGGHRDIEASLKRKVDARLELLYKERLRSQDLKAYIDILLDDVTSDQLEKSGKPRPWMVPSVGQSFDQFCQPYLFNGLGMTTEEQESFLHRKGYKVNGQQAQLIVSRIKALSETAMQIEGRMSKYTDIIGNYSPVILRSLRGLFDSNE